MYRHIRIDKILSINYYKNVPIDVFKRFSLPGNDILQRKGDLYKLTYMSIKEKGVLDPFLCYDIVNVDLDNPPIYRNRKIFGAYLLRGNIRWLCCKDLGIDKVNAIVVVMDHGQRVVNLFRGTDFFKCSKIIKLKNSEDINRCFKGYNPNTKIYKNHLDMSVPSLSDVSIFGVKDKEDTIKRYNNLNLNLKKDYVKVQKVKEKE